jgi:hypothetical protein
MPKLDFGEDDVVEWRADDERKAAGQFFMCV